MIRKWFSIVVLVIAAISLLSVSSCGDPQELVSIAVSPGTETFGASNIPVSADSGLTVQLRALGNYVHPPVQKDITNQVTWTSNDTQMVTVNSTGLVTATGETCGGSLVSATVNTNADASGLGASGAIVTGTMTANVVCFTGTTGGGGGGEPTITVGFSGAGAGIVTSTPAGLSCANTDVSCVASFPADTPVTLTATPVGTSVFGGWTGSCTGGTCTLILEDDATVTATFN
jgi:Big-like domain-containing protein